MFRLFWIDSVIAETEGWQAGWAMTQHPALPASGAGLCQVTSSSVCQRARPVKHIIFKERGQREIKRGGQRERGSEDKDEMDDMCKGAPARLLSFWLQPGSVKYIFAGEEMKVQKLSHK